VEGTAPKVQSDVAMSFLLLPTHTPNPTFARGFWLLAKPEKKNIKSFALSLDGSLLFASLKILAPGAMGKKRLDGNIKSTYTWRLNSI